MGKNSSISNSKNIPKACVIACVVTAITLVSAACFLEAIDALPAPMLTGRFSFDEKLRFLRNNNISDVEIASMGSSEGLSNFSTDVMRKIPMMGDQHFNFSIWGVSISDLSKYWDFLSQFYHPKIMIICVSPYEFTRGTKIAFNEKDLKNYLTGKNPIQYYLKYRGINFFRRMITIRRKRKNSNTFGTLKFDSGGSANIDDNIKNVKEHRWNKKFRGSFYLKSYVDFDEMLKRFKREGTQVVYVVSPMRRNSFREGKASTIVPQHWAKIRSILEKYDMHFFNMHTMLFLEDRFLADATHLNKTGAKYFTEELIKRMEEEGIFEKVKSIAVYKKAPMILDK